MPKQCAICGKTGLLVWKRKKLMSRYNPTVKQRKQPNLQSVKLATGKRVRACAKCIRTIGKKKAEKTK